MQEYSDPRDADEAIRYLNGKDFEGSRLVVEFARRVRDRAPKYSEDAVRRLTFAYPFTFWLVWMVHFLLLHCVCSFLS